MHGDAENAFESYLHAALDGDEIRVRGHATNGAFAVTDRRLLVSGDRGLLLNVPFGTIRRVQFDLELGRPASIAFVSNDPRDEPVLLNVPPEQYAAVSELLLAIGRQLSALSRDQSKGLADNAISAG
jgi:hypothetical protein